MDTACLEYLLTEEERGDSGRFHARYVLDPSTCIERFTRTPPRKRQDRDSVQVADRSSDRGHPGCQDGLRHFHPRII